MMIGWYISKSLSRKPAASAAVFAAASALALLLSVLGHISIKQQAQMEALYDNYDIRCSVSDRQGNTEGLKIASFYIQIFTYSGIEISEYVKDPWFKQSLTYIPAVNPDSPGELTGINCVEADSRLLPVNGAEIIYAEGYSEESFKQQDDIIWVHETMLGIMRLGDTVRLSVQTVEKDFVVAGYFTGLPTTAIYAPWATVHALAISANSGIWVDSLSFSIADNRKLDEFKNLAEQHFLSVDIFAPPAKSLPEAFMSALTIHDTLFKTSLYSLQKNIWTLKILTVVFYTFSVIIGFLLCFIFIRARKPELFLFRCVGLRPSMILVMAAFEQLLLTAAGIIVCMSIWFLLLGTIWPWQAGLLLGCFMLGAATSILLVMRSSLLGYKEE